MKTFHIYRLTIKYWLQGDDWEAAKAYATRIVGGFR